MTTTPVWTDSCAADPEPTPDDDGPWCASLAPEPCDTGQPAAPTVRPLGWHDLHGQISDTELILRPMNTLTPQGGWL